jgi:hypothetical protein
MDCRAVRCPASSGRRPPAQPDGWNWFISRMCATLRPIAWPCVSAVRKWIPAQTLASMISLIATENRSNSRDVPDRPLNIVNETLSVPKKFFRVSTTAPLMAV